MEIEITNGVILSLSFDQIRIPDSDDGPPTTPPDNLAFVDHYPQEPASKRASVTQLPELAPSRKACVLKGILSLLWVAKYCDGQLISVRKQGADESGKRRLVARKRIAYEIGLGIVRHCGHATT